MSERDQNEFERDHMNEEVNHTQEEHQTQSESSLYGSERLNQNYRVENISGYGTNAGFTESRTDTDGYGRTYETPDQSATTYRVYGESPTNPPEPEKKKKKREKAKKSTGMTWSKTIAAALIIGLVAGSAFKGIDIAYDNYKNGSTTADSEKSSTDKVQTVSTISESAVTYDESEMAANVMPSIVSITTTSVETIQSWFRQYQQEVEGSGSGIIIEQSGDELYILTNYHVIEGATSLTVGFSDDSMVSAEVKGYNSDADLAVVVVDMTQMSSATIDEIKLATLGDSDEVSVGEPAYAIGNALGYGQSFTGGYISAVNRVIEDSTLALIQTDAAINPGNSGGALLNAKGEVIGINSSKLVDSTVEGMGFAIPINTAMELMQGVIDGTSASVDSSDSASDFDSYNADDYYGRFFGEDGEENTTEQEIQQSTNKALLGIVGSDVTEEYSEYLNIPQGIYITQVTDDSPAQEAGLSAGDVITAVDGTEYTQMSDLSAYIGEKNPGDTITITFQRKNDNGSYDTQTVTATLAANENVQ